MSLVGPRPLIENEDRQIEGRLRRRLDLTPGLTGLWQAEIPFEEMVNLDYLYATNWSLWGDIKVLMRTFSVVRRGRGPTDPLRSTSYELRPPPDEIRPAPSVTTP
jgi:lipopolysaccharide/colanic/teichoic acid biosynthesis glycosyltransferase